MYTLYMWFWLSFISFWFSDFVTLHIFLIEWPAPRRQLFSEVFSTKKNLEWYKLTWRLETTLLQWTVCLTARTEALYIQPWRDLHTTSEDLGSDRDVLFWTQRSFGETTHVMGGFFDHFWTLSMSYCILVPFWNGDPLSNPILQEVGSELKNTNSKCPVLIGRRCWLFIL